MTRNAWVLRLLLRDYRRSDYRPGGPQPPETQSRLAYEIKGRGYVIAYD